LAILFFIFAKLKYYVNIQYNTEFHYISPILKATFICITVFYMICALKKDMPVQAQFGSQSQYAQNKGNDASCLMFIF